MLAIHTFKESNIIGEPETIANDRKQIKQTLAQMNQIQYGLEGITGFNYFDHNGDTPKPISIGVYKNNKLISALTQLKAVYNENEIADIEKALAQEHLLRVDGKLMYKTNVVYTGMELEEIKDIDFKGRVCTIDFYLWFRYQGEINFQDIVFANAIAPITLGKPVKTANSGQIYYKAFHVVGQFKLDYLSHAYTPGEHLIGIQFHHKSLNENNLIFVTDIIGLRLHENESIARRVQHPGILSPSLDCQVTKAMFHRNVIQKNSLGNLQYLKTKTGMIDYSCFNLEIWIIKNSLSLRGVITNYYWNLTIASLTLLLLFAIHLFRLYLIQHFLRLSWLVHSFCLSMYLLASESVLLEWISGKKIHVIWS
ncbi:MAG: MscS Mechanosensitive ion channel [Candidatus Magnetoglobus multicellularis str. Araruama]|uniref:MscS Mechanosensitive ion channel n=1 Tax=Candidatus Magnetoglobus multicellularis str. Araruama TaxID=890399 RepID=A0A1V1PIA3_9BACT|nr:MAG: MscS Mechanosensitive ion channel [Candidatus Magnetoglobus multicellularis str. Araruama]